MTSPSDAARSLTPADIRKTATHIVPQEIRHWFCEIDGKNVPPKQLVRQAVLDLGLSPLSPGAIPADCVAVLSHHGFTCRNLDWATD